MRRYSYRPAPVEEEPAAPAAPSYDQSTSESRSEPVAASAPAYEQSEPAEEEVEEEKPEEEEPKYKPYEVYYKYF